MALLVGLVWLAVALVREAGPAQRAEGGRVERAIARAGSADLA